MLYLQIYVIIAFATFAFFAIEDSTPQYSKREIYVIAVFTGIAWLVVLVLAVWFYVKKLWS